MPLLFPSHRLNQLALTELHPRLFFGTPYALGKRAVEETLSMPPIQNQVDHDTEETVFVTFAQAALRRAAGWARAQALPLTFQRQFQFVGTSEWHEPIVAIPDYDYWLQIHREDVAALPETQECIRTLWASDAIRYLLPEEQRTKPVDRLTDEQIRVLAGSVICALVDILQRTNSFEPTQEQILDTYARFRAAWTATTNRHWALIPLLNLRAEIAEPLRLTPHYELSPFIDQEKAWVWGVMDGYRATGLIPFHTFIKTEYKLAAEWTQPDLNRVADQEQAIQELSMIDRDMLFDLRNIVTALRLTKPGDVAITAYPQQSDEVPPFGGHPSIRALGVVWSDFQVRRHGNTYTLDATDIEGVRYLIEALGQLDGRPGRAGLEVALRRFNQSYSREYYEDRLIDLTIALESTLLAGISDGKTDLKYRFILHGAALLASRRAHQEVYDFLRAMYDARSAVVHSGKSLSEMKSKALHGLGWREFAQACEDMTREILAEYVRELQQRPGSTVQSITKRLEARVVQSLGSVSQEQFHSEPDAEQPPP